TSRADSRNIPKIGSIQNGCTRLATASPRSYDVTTQPRCVRSVCAASMTYGASMTHFDPPDGTKTPRTAEYTATSGGNVAGVESDNEAREDRRVFQPLARRGPDEQRCRSRARRRLQINSEISRGLPLSRGRRRQPHHQRDHEHLDQHRYHGLPEKDRVTKRD